MAVKRKCQWKYRHGSWFSSRWGISGCWVSRWLWWYRMFGNWRGGERKRASRSRCVWRGQASTTKLGMTLDAAISTWEERFAEGMGYGLSRVRDLDNLYLYELTVGHWFLLMPGNWRGFMRVGSLLRDINSVWLTSINIQAFPQNVEKFLFDAKWVKSYKKGACKW